MKIIAVANQKGGVGKSTSTINIAANIAEVFNKKVMIIDLDPQGHSTKGLGVDLGKDEGTIADGLLDSDDDVHKIVKKTYIDNLFIVPSNLKLALAEMELSSMGAREFKLRSMLPKLGEFDYVFIDCPPTFTTLTINAFTTAQEIIMPVQMSYFCMEGIDGFVQAVNFVNKKINPVVKHMIQIKHVLITFYDKRTIISRDIFEKIKEIFEPELLQAKIPVNIKIGEAQAKGQAIMHYDPMCAGNLSYNEVTGELMNRWKETSYTPSHLGGF